MKIKLLYTLIIYLFTFKSYKHLDLFWCMVGVSFPRSRQLVSAIPHPLPVDMIVIT